MSHLPHGAARRWTVATVAVLFLASLLTACSSDGDAAGPTTTMAEGKARKAKKAEKAGKKAAAGEDDDESSGGREKICGEHTVADTRERPSAEAEVLSEASDGAPRVQGVVYPHPDYEGKPWSQWGQGVVAGGKFWSAIGDHCGKDGNSYFYSYDPENGRLQLTADVNTAAGHREGAWGYGKVHAGLVLADDGKVYGTTYWGSTRGLTYGNGYDGDLLLRLDPKTGDLESLGAPVPKHGIPSLAISPDGRTLYGEAIEPTGTKTGPFFAYDIDSKRVVYQSKSDEHAGFRSIIVDDQARPYWSAGDGKLWRWRPGADSAEKADASIPGDTVRAATPPAPDGTVYAVTKKPPTFFSMSPDGAVKAMNAARGYTTSLAMSKDGRYVYSVPAAHGGASEQQTPVVRLDTRTGKEDVVVELNPLAEKKLGLTLGGTYDIVLDPSGRRLYIGCNANKVGSDDTFGIVALMVVDLPQ